MIHRELLNDSDNFKQFLKQSKQNKGEEAYDKKRIKRVQQDNQAPQQFEQKETQQVKALIKMHKFNQETRRKYRQLIQQKHQQMKILQNLTKSAFDSDKFEIARELKVNKKLNINDQGKNYSKTYQKPVINLKLDTLISSNLIPQKIQIQSVYMNTPFKKDSIQISPFQECDPAFEFYQIHKNTNRSRQIFIKLFNVVEQGLTSQFQNQLSRIIEYLNFDDYLNIIQDKKTHILNGNILPITKQKDSNYPQIILELSKNCGFMGSNNNFDDDDDDAINRRDIDSQNQQTLHRIFICSQKQLTYPQQSIYFTNNEDYLNFKKYRKQQFMKLKIYDKDITINTQVHKIIFSQKIYLINIQDEIRLLIQLSKVNKEEYLMKKIYSDMTNKIDEYLRLICSYTQSTIITRYNISDPYTKIYQFIYKSIIYNKPYKFEQISRQVIQRYKMLQIWYYLPDKIHGYNRDTIHNSLYDLIKATIQYEKKIKQIESYQDLKIKKYNRNYQPTLVQNLKMQKSKFKKN